MKKKSASQTARKLSSKVILLTITGLALLTPAAFGATTTWILNGTGIWFVGSNWDSGEPHSTTDAQINNGRTAQIFTDFPMAEALSLTLGLNAGHSGTVEVLPDHGDLRVGQAIFVGKRGTGKLTSTFGTITSATASIASLTGGPLPPSYGAATIDGTQGARWIISGQCEVGGYNGNPGGIALLSVTNGGTVSAASVYVYPSGTLMGKGTVSTNNGITVAGTLTPSGGTLTLTGDLTFTGTTPLMETNVVPSGADNVSVSGLASLAGKISVTMTGSTFTAGTRYTLLHAGTVSGTFPFVSIKGGSGDCFTAVITYDANNVYLYLSPCSN